MSIPKQDERTPGYPVILNGDHAEFEREHASTPPKERPDWPLPSFDARDWAEAFDKLFIVSRIDGYATKPVDDHVGLMMGWFANALMRGFDEHAARVNAYTSTEALRSALAKIEAWSDDRSDLNDVFAQIAKEARVALSGSPAPSTEGLREALPFQDRVRDWTVACFGSEISDDKIERNHRFLEEALELVQALSCTKAEAHALVDYVYGRSVGEPTQELGGVMVTLAALSNANGFEMAASAETELSRCYTKIEKIRAKQAAKPKHSPLPEHVAAPDAARTALAGVTAPSEVDGK